QSVSQKGTEHRDQMTDKGFLSNHAGGVLGGISSGQDVIARVAFKPTSSIRLGGQTVDVGGHNTDVITKGRHDPCVGIRAVPIVEAMLAIVLLDHALRQRGQNGAVTPETPVIPASAE
ncbi:MAG: chorismate synthase, partial [bacterium]